MKAKEKVYLEYSLDKISGHFVIADTKKECLKQIKEQALKKNKGIFWTREKGKEKMYEIITTVKEVK